MFRRLLEKHNLTRRIFDEINVHLMSNDQTMRDPAIVDAALKSWSNFWKRR
jgi:IS5 family transposase